MKSKVAENKTITRKEEKEDYKKDENEESIKEKKYKSYRKKCLWKKSCIKIKE